MIRVVVTGSECTGKTTLAEALAVHYGTVWAPEYAREFVRTRGAPTARDVDDIARGQIAFEDEAAARASRLLILDTDLLSTVVYSRHYYGSCPAWIEHAFESRIGDLYLLADVDVPWTPDGVYRDRGDRREEMQTLFRDALVTRGLPFVDIRGLHDLRMAAATRAIDPLLKSGERKAESGNPPSRPFSTQSRKGAKTQSPRPPKK
jgi:NadR type nicotinamide-nucleotide adenylyltransferase